MDKKIARICELCHGTLSAQVREDLFMVNVAGELGTSGNGLVLNPSVQQLEFDIMGGFTAGLKRIVKICSTSTRRQDVVNAEQNRMVWVQAKILTLKKGINCECSNSAHVFLKAIISSLVTM
jgi:hypothetical protein